MFRNFSLIMLCLFLLSPQYVFAESGNIEIVEVVLARNVVDLEPQGVFEPPAYCGKSGDRENMLPVVHSEIDELVYLWIKVKSPIAETLRHTWYKAGMGWEKMAEVTLNIQKSPGFRTWSSKKIIPDAHNGKWMVVISAASDPENALCKVDFEIKP
ncbi:MAG: DUF2914 domain-containing protein [Proteobacteria bacterium]|nr:DUF2914 domain-containing protein [Pseudomonadota bacterium]